MGFFRKEPTMVESQSRKEPTMVESQSRKEPTMVESQSRKEPTMVEKGDFLRRNPTMAKKEKTDRKEKHYKLNFI
jgi:DNA-binding transcriptional regulator of glucitol operon